MSERKQTPQDRYLKENSKSCAFRLFYKTEQDIIDKLDSVENKASYIKQLIRQDIERNK